MHAPVAKFATPPHYYLARYVPQFEELVLEHMRGLPSAEWERLREAAKRCTQDEAAMPDWTKLRTLDSPEDLVREACCEAGATLIDVLPRRGAMTVIGLIGGQPVLYCEPSGVYAWSDSPFEGPVLEIWASAPAYPPGWFGSAN